MLGTAREVVTRLIGDFKKKHVLADACMHAVQELSNTHNAACHEIDQDPDTVPIYRCAVRKFIA